MDNLGAEPARRARRALPVVAVLLAAAIALGPLILHYGQKRHNRLGFDIDRLYPEDKPLVGGSVFADTLAAVVEHEYSGRTGWRPNDFFLWGPGLWADNNANRQRGIIQAVRESLRVFKDHLTKVSSDEYDRNLLAADNAFRNDMEKLWLPSAESKLREGVRHLRRYVRGLDGSPMESRPITHRNVELIRLFQAWSDVLGNAHASLYRERVGAWEADDLFYHGSGVAHVMHHQVRAVEREYRGEFASRPVLATLLREIADALGKAAALKPVVVLDGRPAGVLANHRRNLDGYITEARQKIYSVREELEK